MDLGLTDRVVLVTGGSRGIGLACAHTLATEGARVAIASRSQDHLDRAFDALAREGLSVATYRADLTVPSEAASLVADVEQALGPIDVLVNSAGAARRHRGPGPGRRPGQGRVPVSLLRLPADDRAGEEMTVSHA